MLTYGYFALFLSAFLAATILPFSSEALLYLMMQSNDFNLSALWVAATLGNVGGALLNWWLGGYLIHFKERRWFPFRQKEIDKASVTYQKYGVWTLLLAWAPIIGDPLTFIAGFFKAPLPLFLLLVSIGKGGRYALIMLLP